MESGKLPPTALDGVMSYLHKVLGRPSRLYELCLINFTQLREAGRTVQTTVHVEQKRKLRLGLL